MRCEHAQQSSVMSRGPTEVPMACLPVRCRTPSAAEAPQSSSPLHAGTPPSFVSTSHAPWPA